MKTFILIGLLLGGVGKGFCDQAANSFGTGFADAMQRMLEQKDQQARDESRRQSEPAPTYGTYPAAGHYDVRDNNGNHGDMEFATYRQCMGYVERHPLYTECIFLPK